MTLAEEVELAKAKDIVNHARACLAYANGEGAFSYRKRNPLLALFWGPPLSIRAMWAMRYDPIMLPPPSVVEAAEAIIAKHEGRK